MGIEDEDEIPLEHSGDLEQDPEQEPPAGETWQDPDPIEPAVAGMPPVSVGAMLRAARERQDLSVFEVSERLFLTEHYVRALESGDYEKLPGEVYVVGYMKSYALLLGLDVERVLSAYRHSGAPAAYDVIHEHTAPKRVGRFWYVLILIALAGGSAAVGWWAFQAFLAVTPPVLAVTTRKEK